MSDEVWMRVHQKYGMGLVEKKLYSIKTNNCSYLDFPDDVWLDQQKNECECIKNMECVESHEHYIKSKQKTDIILLSLTMVDWINETTNVSDELWMWLHQIYGWVEAYKKY